MMGRRTKTTLVFVLLGMMVVMLPASTLHPVAAASNTEPLWIKQYYTKENPSFFPDSLMLYPDHYLLFNNYISQFGDPIPYVKLTTNGDILSAKVLNLTISGNGRILWYDAAIRPLPDGKILIGVSTFSKGYPSSNITLAKFDPATSSLIWISTINYNITSYNGYQVVGLYTLMNPAVKEYEDGIIWVSEDVLLYTLPGQVTIYNEEVLIVGKFSTTGKIEWLREYTLNTTDYDYSTRYPPTIQRDSEGNIYLSSKLEDQYQDAGYLMKISGKNGSIIWSKRLFYAWDSYYVTPHGYVVFIRKDNRGHRLWTMVVDPDGNRISLKEYTYPLDTTLENIHIDTQTSDGGFLISGYGTITNNQTSQYIPILMKLDDTGDVVYARYYTFGYKDERGIGLYATQDEYGNLVFLTSIVQAQTSVVQKATLLKLDPLGTINCSNCKIRDINMQKILDSNFVTPLDSLSVIPNVLQISYVDPPNVTIKMQPWNTVYSTPLFEDTVCYVPVPTSNSSTNNLNAYVRAGIVWYLLFKHYSKEFNITYQKAEELNVSSSLLSNATTLREEAYGEYQKAVSEGGFLSFPIQKIPYIRRAYLLLLEAYRILKKAVEST